MKIENKDDVKPGHWLTYTHNGERITIQIIDISYVNDYNLSFTCKEYNNNVRIDNVFSNEFNDEVYETEEEIQEKYVEDFI